jgi:hypothetical protein
LPDEALSRDAGRQVDGRWPNEGVRDALQDGFLSPDKNGRPQLDMRGPSPTHPLARKDVQVVYCQDLPSLLLTDLPEVGELGRTQAGDLVQKNRELHTSDCRDCVSTRVTALIGPSGAGKTRTALEALCREYGFYMSFSTNQSMDPPGTGVLQEAIRR